MDPAAFGAETDTGEIMALLGGEFAGEFRPRAVLFRNGNPTQGLYFLEHGIAALHSSTREYEDFVYEVLTPGSVFGEECLSSSGVYSTNATMVSAGSVWLIQAEKLRQHFEESTPGCQWVLDALTQRRSRQNHRLWTTCSRSVPRRLLEMIADLSQWFPGTNGMEADLPISQSMMARMVCSTRETVSTQLNRFAGAQLLVLATRHIGVPSVAALVEAKRRMDEV